MQAGNDIEQQWALLNAPKSAIAVDAPCTVGHGILQFSGALAHLSDAAFAQLNPLETLRFIPASGVASRMFAGLQSDDPSIRAQYQAAVEALPGDASQDWAALPKGAVPFHAGGRTAFADQLTQWAATLPGAALMFTLPEVGADAPPWLADLEAAAESAGVTMNNSVQLSSTQTIAQALDGSRFLDDSGQLLFRPGGHGALIANLNALDIPFISVVNIDNVQPISKQAPAIDSRRRLLGLAAHVMAAKKEALRALKGPHPETTAAQNWLAMGFTAPTNAPENTPVSAPQLIDLLDRPFRIVGVVRNEGQPGGGPFWVRNNQGLGTPQIVERAELGTGCEQLLQTATHFNPVDMVLCGQGYDLNDWIDNSRWLHVDKTYKGRPLKGLERPGLWNGAMGRWNTLMVEVPTETFAPVKTVLDLSGPAHIG